MLKPVTEGWTEPIIHTLLNDGAAVLIQGLTIALIMYGSDHAALSTSGKVTNLDDGTAPNKGKVKFSPGSSDLVEAKSPYTVKWKVTDGAGKDAFWPNGAWETLKVYKQGA